MSVIPPITLLHGNDEYAIQAEIEKLCTGLGDATIAEMNITRFDCRAELDYQALNTAINAMPFLAPRRVVILLHPVAAISQEDHDKILGLISKTPETTTVALAEFDQLKGKNKNNINQEHWLIMWAQKASPRVVVRLYNRPNRFEMARWIEGQAKKQGGAIDVNAAAHLAEMVGEDTLIAAREITKLLTYVNFERPVSLLDVEKVSIVSAPGSIFELVDALGMGDGKKAQHILHQLLEEQDAKELWGMVIRQFRLLLQAREILDQNGNGNDVQKSLSLHPFVAQKITAQVRGFTLPTLEAIYHKLVEIDEGEKTSQVPLDLALDTLIVELSTQN